MAARKALGKQWDVFGPKPNKVMSSIVNKEARITPRKYHDMVWEGSLEPELDRWYKRTTGDIELNPGHWHFYEDNGTVYKQIATSMCKGRHTCPPATQKVRNDLAQEFFMIDAARNNAK